MAVEGPEFERAFRGAIQYALNSELSEILELRPVQEEALLHFIKREDVFAVLPTGCGKSLIFQLVPKVCSYLHHRGFSYPKAAILVIICPLNALIDSHILELKEHGIPACSLADDDLPEDDVASHSIIFTSPELIVREEKWRKVWQSKSFEDRLFGLVTDEAHVVPKW
ncbi:ATP-dependent DNA helicase Q1 [Acropora cervicornis]|uniref:ATP-dependent DNA helicase Q1 n=1 Tax=Acropora cervicornis TaxID=6130 RepID=A0AAD9V332_ACRCE|nr:ATP-dependent DNA helicase Q1 [Acropora cervicornis]